MYIQECYITTKFEFRANIFHSKSIYKEDRKDLVERLSSEKEMTQTEQRRKLTKEYIAGLSSQSCL